MDRYTQLGSVSLTAALDKLPPLPRTADETQPRLLATGTDGAVNSLAPPLALTVAIRAIR